MLDPLIVNQLRSGCVIPAHPLALQSDNRIDERHQKALTRYYLAAGAGGLAVGVHTTQFAIHEPKIGLYRPVLELAIETARQFTASAARSEPIMIAGIVGDTKRAMRGALRNQSLSDKGRSQLQQEYQATIENLVADLARYQKESKVHPNLR